MKVLLKFRNNLKWFKITKLKVCGVVNIVGAGSSIAGTGSIVGWEYSVYDFDYMKINCKFNELFYYDEWLEYLKEDLF